MGQKLLMELRALILTLLMGPPTFTQMAQIGSSTNSKNICINIFSIRGVCDAAHYML